MEMEREMEKTSIQSIYKASRTIKRKDSSLYNALRSIYSDSVFVGEIAQLWPQLPLLANLRCGLWYAPRFDATCYFKSTDGHTNNWSFNTSRLNLHVALLAGQKGGCIIIDSTRKGKRFPDSMSKTIPIWTCVLNRAIAKYRKKMCGTAISGEGDSNTSSQHAECIGKNISDWDCSLHLPLWVSPTEKSAIENRLENWTIALEASGADISSLSSLKKPLHPLWISPKTVIWLNEVPEYDSWDFTPIILVSSSSENGNYRHVSTSEFSWNYISGAGDDEESWARGLSPALFWNNVYDIINVGPDLCNQKVADIVEKDRVYRAHRGYNAPQLSIKTSKNLVCNGHFSDDNTKLDFDVPGHEGIDSFSRNNDTIFWVGVTNIAVGASRVAVDASDVDCILNCDNMPKSIHLDNLETCLYLPIVSSKSDRSSLIRHLPSALNFAKINLRRGKKLMICCSSGEDISICVCLAILTSLFTEEGLFDNGKTFSEACITKFEMRRRLVFLCKFAVNARPSRGNLRQVFNFLIGRNTPRECN